ncbi:hypothetical protein BCON_0184g00230 [Botryotinia convoluta]|uniref:Natural resistance-associated macrophage protein n=1 Tax=Botryotinia convoluta TaxID=54673 RepID=A0A4Z1HMZ3_9HELO|nr:hypothetical protein BCON_0184g00230 [Botryotinia convoluta]
MDQPGIHIFLAEPASNSLESKHSNEKKSNSSRNFLPLRYVKQVAKSLWKFAKFTCPGAIISVAYIDPDNYQSDLTAGALFEYKLLCAVVFSNLAAVFLRALSTKLGCVTGMDLAQMNRAHLYPWVNIALWILAEGAIIWRILDKITLIAGCMISVSDTLFIVLFYEQNRSIQRLRFFEMFTSIFVIAIFIMFCIELSFITAPAGQVFKSLLPSKTIFTGGNLMPHTIYLGSGLVRARMREGDHRNEKYHEARTSSSRFAIILYRPTLSAIKSCMSYTIAELCITLFVVANFVNSAILIVAAASLSEEHGDADLPGMYHLFVEGIGQAAGTIFVVGLLFSGVSAGIVATMAGQLICEGAMNWRMSPFLRRLVTRCIVIVPTVVIAAATGQRRLKETLMARNVVLSVSLIFITAPLVWYTSCERYMGVGVEDGDGERGVRGNTISLANGWVVTGIGWLLWFVVAGMNVALLAFLGLGMGGDD